MPVFLVDYVTPSGFHETEWVCPTGYTKLEAYRSFVSQNPAAFTAALRQLPEQEQRQ
jgi:hypothetical protein